VRLEILQGHRSYKWPGAIIGAACGTLIGVGIGYAFTREDDWGNMSREIAMTVGGIGLGILGIGIGALVGQAAKTDKWEEVPLDRLRVSVVPTRRGFGIGARIAF